MKKLSLLAASVFLYSTSIKSQDLPNIQKESVWMTAPFKADGKLTEWNGSLQAFNRATGIKYALSNDDENLYLAIMSEDKTTTAKILAGGISVAFAPSGGKVNTASPEMTFPVTNSKYRYGDDGWISKTFRILSEASDIHDAIHGAREIKLSGFKGVSDSIISIYNEHDLKAAMGYDGTTLVWEAAIPLASSGLPEKFVYQVKLNGVPVPPRSAGTPLPTSPPPPPVILPKGAINEMEIRLVTYFIGQYNLAKAGN